MFEICLWQPIVEAESCCTVANGEAIFRLVKETAETWPFISAEVNRQEALQIKQKTIEEAQAKAEVQRKEIAGK